MNAAYAAALIVAAVVVAATLAGWLTAEPPTLTLPPTLTVPCRTRGCNLTAHLPTDPHVTVEDGKVIDLWYSTLADIGGG